MHWGYFYQLPMDKNARSLVVMLEIFQQRTHSFCCLVIIIFSIVLKSLDYFFVRHSNLCLFFVELMRTADELRLKIGKLKTKRMEEKGIQYIKDLKIDYLNKDLPIINHISGNSWGNSIWFSPPADSYDYCKYFMVGTVIWPWLFFAGLHAAKLEDLQRLLSDLKQ